MYFKGQNAEAMFEQLDKDHSVRLCAALQLESSSPQVLTTSTHHKISAARAGLPRPQRSAGAVQDARQEDEPIGGADGDG